VVALGASMVGCASENPTGGGGTSSQPPSIVGTWRGHVQTPTLGEASVETIFTANGDFSQLTVTPLPPYQLGITGHYEVDTRLKAIHVTNQQPHPEVYCPAGPASCERPPVPARQDYLYTFLDNNTLKLEQPGCTGCEITYSRVTS